MTIEEYSFGRIRIDGKEFTSDVIVYPERVNAPWWRREGHRLDPEDLVEVLREPPEVLVIGTGSSGCMEVPVQTLKALQSKRIEPRVAKTADAVKDFNRLQKEGARVVAALHLTC